jgi:hypothetical protein
MAEKPQQMIKAVSPNGKRLLFYGVPALLLENTAHQSVINGYKLYVKEITG